LRSAAIKSTWISVFVSILLSPLDFQQHDRKRGLYFPKAAFDNLIDRAILRVSKSKLSAEHKQARQTIYTLAASATQP